MQGNCLYNIFFFFVVGSSGKFFLSYFSVSLSLQSVHSALACNTKGTERAARSGTRMKSSLLSAADSCMGLMKQVNHILSLVPAEIRTGELVQEHQVKDNSQPFPETFPVR